MTSSLRPSLLLLLLPLLTHCNPAFERSFDLGDTHVSLGLLTPDRFKLVRAVDVLAFNGDQFDCPTLLSRRLDDPTLRAQAASTGSNGTTNPEHVRICQSTSLADGGSSGATLGRILEGKKTVLVTASYLSEACTTGANGGPQGPEVALPGHVLAAGCETTTVQGGKLQPLSVVLVPFRDPVP
jgi:hypothetical protein